MTLDSCQVEELVNGYKYSEQNKQYICLICGAVFNEGEVYVCGEHFFQPEKAIQYHLQSNHPSYRHDLIYHESKYNALTDNQKTLMSLFAAGRTDKEIAKELAISTSTVRHQKFIFREKAKQARLYLAAYETVFRSEHRPEEDIAPIHDHAKMVDMRYVITEEEKQKVIDTYFSSLEPLKLKEFPAREKKKVAALTKICEQFESGKQYTEKEINDILAEIYHDFPTIRRYLIQYGFMKREKDGALYWRT